MAITISGTTGLSVNATPYFVGQLVVVMGSVAPPGCVKLNGQALSRTVYADLFAVCGTTYGAGDGSTTFNVADVRGEFIRCLDDGRGIDTGRVRGSAQSDDLKSHSHTFNWGGNNAAGGYLSNYVTTNSGPSTTNTTGGTETRPRNVAFLACVFAGV